MKTLRALVIASIMATIVTGIFAVVAYGQSAPHSDYTLTANRYKSETPPLIWYNWTDIGIVAVRSLNGSSLHIDIDDALVPSDLQPLQMTQPIFRWNSTYYRVSPLWGTPALPSKLIGWAPQVSGIAAVAFWIGTSIVYLRKRRKEQ